MSRLDEDFEDFVLVGLDDEDIRRAPQALALLGEVERAVDDVAESFWPINQCIHDHPELGYHEIRAHAALTDFMGTQQGWKVTPSAYGMDTAWVAVFDSGKKGPTVSFNAEMGMLAPHWIATCIRRAAAHAPTDSLPGIGHACGHNLIATASVLGAIAAAKMMESHDLPGKIVLFGTPAEEGS